MKDYGRILASTKRDSLQEIIPVKARNEITEWSILKHIEQLCTKMRVRLQAILDAHWRAEISQVKLDFFGTAEPGTKLMLKAQLYRLSNKQLLLKVFAHQVGSNGQASKLARAAYHIQITNDSRVS
ncbi:MAG: hypothetical protein U5L96_21305 [Owenweeksia sp.]|nr:hypothetical protein [Owenweeksia sp.]